MRFIVQGRQVELDRSRVEALLSGVAPEPVQKHGVRVHNAVYPVKQALEAVTGIPRSDFTSQTARRLLAGVGLELVGEEQRRQEPEPRASREQEAATAGSPEQQGWPWEGSVQAVFAGAITARGWSLLSLADTASRAQGIDVLARKGARRLGAEVKGWPAPGYADPRRAAETKKTQPSTQAGHWFAQALMKAVMLRDSHPDHESLIVLPDQGRYRDLAGRTRTGRRGAEVHVVLLQSDGSLHSETWTP